MTEQAFATAGPADTADSLLERSDTAMYQAKRETGALGRPSSPPTA